MKPYASGRRWTLYCADNRQVRDTIPATAALISDPPYGMDWNTDSTRFSGGASGERRYRQEGRNDWREVAEDAEPFDPSSWLEFPQVVLSGYNHFAPRLPVGTLLVWLKKPEHLFGTFLSDAEIAWMKGGHGVYCLPVSFPPPTRGREASGDSKCAVPGHPTQKPVALCAWWMTRAKVPADGIVADPYAGSGSTGVAAIASGRSFWGCEIEERYAEVAARRLEQAEHDGQQVAMFGPPP